MGIPLRSLLIFFGKFVCNADQLLYIFIFIFDIRMRSLGCASLTSLGMTKATLGSAQIFHDKGLPSEVQRSLALVVMY